MILNGAIWKLAQTEGVLTDLQRQVLELRELHGCTWNQISYMIDRDQSTVRGHYNRAQRRLYTIIENQEDV